MASKSSTGLCIRLFPELMAIPIFFCNGLLQAVQDLEEAISCANDGAVFVSAYILDCVRRNANGYLGMDSELDPATPKKSNLEVAREVGELLALLKPELDSLAAVYPNGVVYWMEHNLHAHTVMKMIAERLNKLCRAENLRHPRYTDDASVVEPPAPIVDAYKETAA